MTAVLDDKQEAAFKKLSVLKVGALFMKMGTGKTLVAMQLVNSVDCDICLWICPFSVKDAILKEYKKWAFSFEIVIIGCESIGSSERIFNETLELIENKKVFCVADESITIKNREAKRTKRITAIGRQCEYRLILNGTPISRNIIDLWSQMDFLSPLILKMTYKTYKNTFTEYYIRGPMRGRVKQQHNIEHLIKLISPYIFESDLSLGAGKLYYDYEYENEFKDEYEEIKNKYIDRINGGGGVDFFAMSTELQMCYTMSYQRQKMIEAITNNNEQYIVFVRYLGNIPKDQQAITGELSSTERRTIFRRFENGDFSVLYLTYGIGSMGLNLQFSRNIIFADQTFDYMRKLQAEHRIFRKGQPRNVNYYNFWCRTGMENIFKACLEKKTRLSDELKKEIQKNGLKNI